MNNITESEPKTVSTLEFGEFQNLYASLGRRAEQKLATLVASFTESAADLLAEARQALADGDRETLNRAAHTLKATAAMMGAQALSELARELEWATKESIPTVAADWLVRAETEYIQAKAALVAAQQEVLSTGGTDQVHG